MSHKITDLEKNLSGITNDNFVDLPITSIVESEHAAWGGKKETNASVYPRLQAYWSYTIPNWQDWTPSSVPWSAAYISWILRNQQFPKDASHAAYSETIIKSDGGWDAFSIPKTKDLKLQIGNVLVRPRSSSYTASHGDVVYKFEDGYALLSGGNISDSAKIARRIKVDDNNYVIDEINDYKIILKKKSSGMSSTLIPILAFLVGAGVLVAMRK